MLDMSHVAFLKGSICSITVIIKSAALVNLTFGNIFCYFFSVCQFMPCLLLAIRLDYLKICSVTNKHVVSFISGLGPCRFKADTVSSTKPWNCVMLQICVEFSLPGPQYFQFIYRCNRAVFHYWTACIDLLHCLCACIRTGVMLATFHSVSLISGLVILLRFLLGH